MQHAGHISYTKAVQCDLKDNKRYRKSESKLVVVVVVVLVA